MKILNPTKKRNKWVNDFHPWREEGCIYLVVQIWNLSDFCVYFFEILINYKNINDNDNENT